jgi:hypothetical protein
MIRRIACVEMYALLAKSSKYPKSSKNGLWAFATNLSCRRGAYIQVVLSHSLQHERFYVYENTIDIFCRGYRR